MQQFGGTKARFPNLWGNIPARPFLGVSAADKDEILEILREALLGAAGRG
jgi:phage gpG-like protein